MTGTSTGTYKQDKYCYEIRDRDRGRLAGKHRDRYMDIQTGSGIDGLEQEKGN